MRPNDDIHRSKNGQGDLFRSRLSNLIDLNHPLCTLAEKFRWKRFEVEFGKLFSPKKGRTAVPTRIIVGLLYLKHTYNQSDEDVVARFVENPYWQHFCGFDYFQLSKPCDPTVLVKWRKRMGEEGMEILLQETLAVAHEEGILKKKDLNEVIVDTTVQEKNISFPTDAKLLDRARRTLVVDAKARGIELRQTYSREGKFQLVKYQGYCHAKQFRRAKKPLKRLKTLLGRVIRDLGRKLPEPDQILQRHLEIAGKILIQKKSGKEKIYSVHEPEVECISKGKAHKRYEFGCKVSVATTNRSNWVVGVKAMHGRPYDGHTLSAALEQVKKIVGRLPSEVYVDKGYKGSAKLVPIRVFMSGQKRGVDKRRKKLLRRRSAVEPVIGHLKDGHRMRRNFLKGLAGDKNNAILAGIGFNMAKLLAALCFLFPELKSLMLV